MQNITKNDYNTVSKSRSEIGSKSWTCPDQLISGRNFPNQNSVQIWLISTFVTIKKDFYFENIYLYNIYQYVSEYSLFIINLRIWKWRHRNCFTIDWFWHNWPLWSHENQLLSKFSFPFIFLFGRLNCFLWLKLNHKQVKSILKPFVPIGWFQIFLQKILTEID